MISKKNTLLLSTIFTFQCSQTMENTIIPSKNIIQKSYSIDSDFGDSETVPLHAVRLAFGKLIITQIQDGKQELLVKTSHNIMDFVKPQIYGTSNKYLELLLDEGIKPKPFITEIEYILKVKSLDQVEALERASVSFDTNFKLPSLLLFLKGEGEIETINKLDITQDLKTEIKGRGHIRINDISCQRIKEKISDGGIITITKGTTNKHIIKILDNGYSYAWCKSLSGQVTITGDAGADVIVNVDNDLIVDAPPHKVTNRGKAKTIYLQDSDKDGNMVEDDNGVFVNGKRIDK